LDCFFLFEVEVCFVHCGLLCVEIFWVCGLVGAVYVDLLGVVDVDGGYVRVFFVMFLCDREVEL